MDKIVERKDRLAMIKIVNRVRKAKRADMVERGRQKRSWIEYLLSEL